MKRCRSCTRPVALTDVLCRRCGVVVEPPPPRWLRILSGAYWVSVTLVFGSYVMRAVRFALATDAGRYVVAHYPDIIGFLFAAVVAPLCAVYFGLRFLVDAGDRLDLEVRKWRAERFRKYGW